jgi:quinoprotein glucose dehydrogenase
MLRANADKDVFLRHAGIMGLVGTADRQALLSAAKDNSRSVRMAVLVAMRQRQMPEIAHFLQDRDQLIIMDGVRAINDLPITEALPQLAGLIEHPSGVEMLDWRVINANARVGGEANAVALATYAARNDAPEKLRCEAVLALSEWASPNPRDRVTGLVRPLAARDGRPATVALRPVIRQLMASAPDSVKQETVVAMNKLAMTEMMPVIFVAAVDTGASSRLRVLALDTLSAYHDSRLAEAVKVAVADNDATVRATGNRLQASIKTGGAADTLGAVVENGKTLGEKQGALATLGTMEDQSADTVLAAWLDKLIAGKVPREIQLDLLDAAARKRSSDLVKGKLKEYTDSQPQDDEFLGFREALYGGDAEAGRKIFFERPDASCVRCHKVKGEGGAVGPELTGIITRHDREYILESILFPNKQIAPGFESLMVEMKAGQTYAGVVKSQDDEYLNLFSIEDNAVVKLRKSDIQKQVKGQSPMPEGLGNILKKDDLRNLVEFLATAK